jgi:heme/copper-type cytochrome/quinol oxidase subunit 2
MLVDLENDNHTKNFMKLAIVILITFVTFGLSMYHRNKSKEAASQKNLEENRRYSDICIIEYIILFGCSTYLINYAVRVLFGI